MRFSWVQVQFAVYLEVVSGYFLEKIDTLQSRYNSIAHAINKKWPVLCSHRGIFVAIVLYFKSQVQVKQEGWDGGEVQSLYFAYGLWKRSSICLLSWFCTRQVIYLKYFLLNPYLFKDLCNISLLFWGTMPTYKCNRASCTFLCTGMTTEQLQLALKRNVNNYEKRAISNIAWNFF